MASNIQFILNNSIVPPPQNWESISFELDFNRDEKKIDTGALVWLGDQAAKINKYVDDGTSGGEGIMIGMPLRIEVCDTNEILFDGYLDLADVDTSFECDRVVTQIKEAGKIDWLNDIADSFSFAFLYAEGNIQYNDFKNIPYVISSIPDYTQLLPLSVSLYLITVEIFKTFKEIAATVADAVGGITGVAAAVIYITALLIYATLLILAVVQLIKEFIKEMIQPDKFKKGMLVSKHFEIAANYLGLTFVSSIIGSNGQYKDLHIIPQKRIIKGLRIEDERTQSLSPLSYGHYDGTFGDLIRDLQDMFNAEVIIKDNVMYFELEGFFSNVSGFNLPQLEKEGVGTNMSELNTNFFMTYQVDEQDQNTLDFFTGTSVQVTHTPAVFTNGKTRLNKGIKTVRIPFARCVPKLALTRVEKTLQFMVDNMWLLYAALGAMFGVIGWILAAVLTVTINLSFNVSYRIGWLNLSNDFTGVPKIGLFDFLGRVSPLNITKTSARQIMDTYHRSSFIIDPLNNDHNQKELFENREVGMCCADFIKVKDNSVLKDFEQNPGKFRSVKWNPFNEQAVISYEVEKLITTNFVEKVVIDGA